MTSDPSLVVIQDRIFGTGYTESQTITDSSKLAYASGGPGTYEWIDDRWVKAEQCIFQLNSYNRNIE